MSDARREMTYSDLQVRVLEQQPTQETEDAVIVAVTVQNTGTVDDTEHVHVFVAPEQSGRGPVLVQATAEKLEVDHSHRVRCTVSGADLAAADDPAAGAAAGIRGGYVISVGPSAEDLRVEAPVTLG